MNTARYVIGLLVVVTIPPAIAFWYLVHPFAQKWRSWGARWAYPVTFGVMFAMIGALAFVHEALMGRDLGTSWPLAVVGLLLYAWSIVLEWQCRKHLTFKILVGVPELSQSAPGKLLTEGLYGRMRHPRYVAIFVGVTGWALFANHTGVYLVAAGMIPAFYLLTVMEERELLDRFGAEYAAYRERVPRFIPSWASVRDRSR